MDISTMGAIYGKDGRDTAVITGSFSVNGSRTCGIFVVSNFHEKKVT
jgi:hypothetical protein